MNQSIGGKSNSQSENGNWGLTAGGYFTGANLCLQQLPKPQTFIIHNGKVYILASAIKDATINHQ
jgi:hypothetical protein